MRLFYRSISMFTKYKVPYNINKEEHASYITKVERSEEMLTENQKVNLIPRRKRRIYDTPKIDENIQGYGAWRVFQQQQIMQKHNEHAMQVFNLLIQPKWLVHAFGKGAIPVSNPRSASKQYYFQDNRFNSYLLYEYRNTTHFKPNLQNYDYQNQPHIHPRSRLIKRLAPEEFWASQSKFPFRFNFSVYAEKFKFKKWLLSQIQKRKSGKSYDQYIDEKYGKVLSFNKKEDMQRFQPLKPIVTNVTPESFNVNANANKEKAKKGEKKEKVEKGDKGDKNEKTEKTEKSEKTVQQAEKAEKTEAEKPDEPQKPGRQQKSKKDKKKQKQPTDQSKQQPQKPKQPKQSKQTVKVPIAKILDEKYRIRERLTENSSKNQSQTKEKKAEKQSQN